MDEGVSAACLWNSIRRVHGRTPWCLQRETIRTWRRCPQGIAPWLRAAAVYCHCCSQVVIPAAHAQRSLGCEAKRTMEFAFWRKVKRGEAGAFGAGSSELVSMSKVSVMKNQALCERIKRTRVPKQTQWCSHALFHAAPFNWCQVEIKCNIW